MGQVSRSILLFYSNVPTLSLLLNVCGCYISIAVYIKFSFSFSTRHPWQTCNLQDQHSKAHMHQTDGIHDAHQPNFNAPQDPLVSVQMCPRTSSWKFYTYLFQFFYFKYTHWHRICGMHYMKSHVCYSKMLRDSVVIFAAVPKSSYC